MFQRWFKVFFKSVARIRDPYIGAKCYINVMLCHAMLLFVSILSLQFFFVLVSTKVSNTHFSFLCRLYQRSGPPSGLHLPSAVPRCLLAPTTPYFFPKNCFIISAMLFNDLFNEFVQRFCSKMVSFFQEFSFVSKNFLFPSAMFNVRFQRLFSKTFLSHIFR